MTFLRNQISLSLTNGSGDYVIITYVLSVFHVGGPRVVHSGSWDYDQSQLQTIKAVDLVFSILFILFSGCFLKRAVYFEIQCSKGRKQKPNYTVIESGRLAGSASS